LADTTFRGRLRDSINVSLQNLKRFRVNRAKFVEVYAGNLYNPEGSNFRKTPDYVNLIQSMVRTFTYLLVSNDPAAHVYSPNSEYTRSARLLKLIMNDEIKRMGLGEVMSGCVLDSFFGMGIIKVGLEKGSRPGVTSAGFCDVKPFAARVDLDNWVQDMGAADRAHMQFMGDFYRVPLKEVQQDERFDKDMREKLTAVPYCPVDNFGIPKVQNLTRRGSGIVNYNDLHDQTNLLDVWLPQEKVLYTTDFGLALDKPLRELDWNGPEHGPYHFLEYVRVPNNPFPVPPVMTVSDLSRVANELYYKVVQQGLRQKTITAYDGTNEADAQRIKNAKDGEVVHVNNMRGIQEAKLGGPTQEVGIVADDVMKKFNFFGGNPDLLSGSAKPSPTATQDTMFQEASSQMLASQQDQVYACTRGVLEDIAWYVMDDPDPQYTIFDAVLKGIDPIPQEVSKEDLRGSWINYTFDIVPYSMAHMTPGQRLNSVQQFLGAFAPFAQMAAAQGVTLDVKQLAEIWANNRNLPEIKALLHIDSGITSDLRSMSGGEGGPKIKAPTNSTYTRVSESGGRQSPLTMNEMAGGNPGGLSGLGATQGA